MASPVHVEKGQIQDHMPVVCSDGKQFGAVDHLAGDYIKLSRSDPETGGIDRFLPVSAVMSLEGGVIRLAVPAMQAKRLCLTEEEVRKRTATPPHPSSGRRMAGDPGPEKGTDMQDDLAPGRERDPGDAVPEGVAVQEPAPLSEHDKAVKQRLEELGRDQPKDGGRRAP